MTLAAISLKNDQLEISEEAYCASLQVDKVEYLQHIKVRMRMELARGSISIKFVLKELPPSSPEQLAEKCVMMGRLGEAETLLTNNKKYEEAVDLLLRLHNYDRALDIAEQHQAGVERVLSERKRYIEALGRNEFSPKFLRFGSQ